MTRRGRVIALTCCLAALLAAGTLILLGTRTPDCGVITPRPSLPAALRAIGDFDQAYSADAATLQDVAGRAASAEYPGLIGSVPESPVKVAARTPGTPDAIVVPLRAPRTSDQATPALAGLVVFLQDCGGRAFFNTIENDSGDANAPAAFPAVSRDRATAELGTTQLVLAYISSPLKPVWVTAAAPTRSLPAR